MRVLGISNVCPPKWRGWLLAILWGVGGAVAASGQYTETPESSAQMVPDAFSAEVEAEREPFAVRHYVIDAELIPATHEIKARAEVVFEARARLRFVELELNQNLFPTNITDAEGEILSARRAGDGLKIEIALPRVLEAGETYTIAVEYAGILVDAEYSPVEGVQLAYIGEETSYLLYPARWFPVAGYGTNRFTAELHLTVPDGYQVLSSGRAAPPEVAEGKVRFSFSAAKPQFAGSIAVVSQPPHLVEAEGQRMKVAFSAGQQQMVQAYGETAARMMNFFSSIFGPPPVASLSIVEIGDSSLGGFAAPEVIFLASRAIGSEVNISLLAQEVAQQWWRGLVSPATRADLWLDHGLSTYSDALYMESLGGEQILEARIRQMATDALTHDTVPIRGASRMGEFTPAYKALLYDKAGYVLHMLRWVVGDDHFFTALRQFAEQYAFQPASTNDFRQVMEQVSGQDLEGFFLQWLSSTGASDFTLDYTIYRVTDGYSITGTITQDNDLFSMPVEVQVETVTDPVATRVLVSGRSSDFSIATETRPLKIVIDPNNRILKYNDEIRVRVAIARGEQAMAQNDYTAALEEYQKALDIRPLSSLAHYRAGEVFFVLRNYQSAVNAFREALNGDLEPTWTEVWSHINMGKIFDVTGQRDRAVNEYQQAIRTKDESQGALEEAQRYLDQPYERITQSYDGEDDGV